MNAIIDKSLLQEICKQSQAKMASLLSILQKRYVLRIPEILVEEIISNYVRQSPQVEACVENMVDFLQKNKETWIADPLEISFQELVVNRGPLIDFPKPAHYMTDIVDRKFTINSVLKSKLKERKNQKDIITKQIITEQRKILNVNQCIPLKNKNDFFSKLVQPEFENIISDQEKKKRLLDRDLRRQFIFTHQEHKKEIDDAFTKYTLQTYKRYSATYCCLIVPMFYIYAPLIKIDSPNSPLRKILKRDYQGQKNNLNDEKYIQSALLCDCIATRDRGMMSIMDLFKVSGLWKGEILFIDPQKDLECQMHEYD